MLKPNGYEEAQASGEFTPVNLGGHHAIVKQVKETKSSNGLDMIVVAFDFAKNDEQPEYFMNRFKADDRENAKWPFNGTKYILVNDYQDRSKTSRAFKTFCNAIEKSNGVEIKWGGADWGQQFRNRKIGVVFGEEEHEYEGKISMRRVPKWFCRDDAVETAGIPEAKYLNGKAPATARTSAPDSQGFMAVTGDEEDIPF